MPWPSGPRWLSVVLIRCSACASTLSDLGSIHHSPHMPHTARLLLKQNLRPGCHANLSQPFSQPAPHGRDRATDEQGKGSRPQDPCCNCGATKIVHDAVEQRTHHHYPGKMRTGLERQTMLATQ